MKAVKLLIVAGIISFSKSASTSDRILIIGAGMAGASAATRLHELGYTHVTIIDASDVVGGRCGHVTVGDHVVSNGATWVHGTGTNPIYGLVERFNMSYFAVDYEDYIVRNKAGHDVTAEADNIYVDKFEPAIEAFDADSKTAREENRSDYSLRAGLLKGGWLPSSELEDAIEFFEIDFEFAVNPDATSGKYAYINEPFSIHNTTSYDELIINDTRGYDYMIRSMFDEILTEEHTALRLNNKVTHIKEKKDRIIVTTNNGEKIVGDVAIVTVSLGVLQHGEVQFSPDLPEWKTDAFQQFQMALFTQIYLQFDEAFWDDIEYIVYAGGTDKYSAWVNFNKILPGSNMLMVSVAEEDSKTIERLTDSEIIDDVMKTLEAMYILLDVQIPRPIGYTVSRYTYNPLTYGAWTNWPPAFTEDSHLALTSPVGRVYFAGDYGDSPSYGYLQGAYYSGRNTADDIHACLLDHLKCRSYTPPPRYC